jgi:hypothetical protein
MNFTGTGGSNTQVDSGVGGRVIMALALLAALFSVFSCGGGGGGGSTPADSALEGSGEGGSPSGGGNGGWESSTPLALAFGETYKGEEFASYLRELHVNRTKFFLHWLQIEPSRDEYTFDLIDAFLDQLEPGEEPLVTIFTSSDWAAEGVGKGFPPLDYDEYYEFIYTLVSHCKGKVKYWQRDTEPATDNHWDINRYVEYVDTQKRFFDAVKDADPDALVIGVGHAGGWWNGEIANPRFFEYFLHFARDHFDILDVRLYRDQYTIPDRVGWFRDKMEQLGYDKPIVSTEYGGPDPSQFEDGFSELTDILVDWRNSEFFIEEEEDRVAWWKYLHSVRDTVATPSARMFLAECDSELEEKQTRIFCRDMVQRTTLILSTGIELAWYWNLCAPWFHSLGPHPLFGKLRLVDARTGVRQPLFYNYQRMAGMFEGFAAITAIEASDPDTYAYRLDRGDRGDLYVAWEKRDLFSGEDLPASSVDLTCPWLSVKVTDVFGNEQVIEGNGDGTITLDLTDTPLYLEEDVIGS